MKITTQIIFMILLNGISLEPLSAKIYQWTDSEGGLHFSDTQNPQQASKPISIRLIPIIKTQRVPPIRINNKRIKPVTLHSMSEEDICQNLSNKIKRVEKKLSRRHSASRFDQLISDLKELRWNKLKNC